MKVKFALRKGEGRGWPRYLLWGRVRTSTAALLLAFIVAWWLYDNYQPAPPPIDPATQVVPPGFVPDPDYTWVPRTSVRPRETETTTTTTPTTTETTTPTDTTDTTTSQPTDTTTPSTTATTTPTPLFPGQTPQTTAENRSGTPTTTPTVTAPALPGLVPAR